MRPVTDQKRIRGHIAALAKADSSVTQYGQLVDIQATSNIVTLSRQAWAVTLTTSVTTFTAGQNVAFTATANQSISNTNGNYGIYIFNSTTGALFVACLPSYSGGSTCAPNPRVPYYTGGPYDYIAAVAKADSSVTQYGQLVDIQAISNIVTLTRQVWTVTLTTDAATFAAGQNVAMTATANQSMSNTNGNYGIYVFNKTTGALFVACLPSYSSGSTCAPNPRVPFYTGGPYDYLAVVAKADSSVTQYGQLIDIQATSNIVTLTRQAWTVTLTADATTFSAGQNVAITATASQNFSYTNGNYGIYIFNKTTGAVFVACLPPGSGGRTCAPNPRVPFYTGGPYDYVAVVAKADSSVTQYSQLTDIQATSNIVTLARQAWTLGLTGTASRSGSTDVNVTFTAAPNQSVSGTNGTYSLVFLDYTAGTVAYATQPGDISFSISRTFSLTQAPHTYVAMIAAYNRTTGVISDIQATSNGFSAPDGAGAVLAGETAGGSNPAEANCQRCQGDPINTATGEFSESATDVGVPGKGPGLMITRSYASSTASTSGAFGYGWSYNYGTRLSFAGGNATDPLPRTVTVTQENGSTVMFSEDAARHYAPPARVLATLAYDATRQTWTFTRKAVQSMVFDATGRLTSLADSAGSAVSLSYGGSGQLASVSASGGRSLALTWSGGHVATVTDSASRTVTYSYDAAGNLATVTAVDGAITSYGYDSSHYLTSVTQPGGGITRNVYDSGHRVTSQTDPVGRVTGIAYAGAAPSLTTTTTGPDGAKTVETYSNGQLLQETKASGTPTASTWVYTYDAANNVASVTDPGGARTSYTYDPRGNRTSQTDPLTRTTMWTFDALNGQTSVTDSAGRHSTATYDSNGSRLSVTSPTGRTAHWTYNSDATLATATDAAGHTSHHAYDTAGNLTATTDADTRTTQFGYDPAGHVTALTSPAGKITTTTFDPAGRILSVTDPAGHATSTTYDADGHQLSVTDPTGHTSSNAYDLAGQLTSTTDPTGAITSFTYTLGGYLASATDPNGHTTGYTYDLLGDRLTATDPDNRTTRYAYDGDGRLLSATTPGGAVSTTTYDAAGQTTKIVDATQHTTSYTYDTAGQLATTTDPDGQATTLTYTGDGQIASRIAPNSATTHYSYDPAGRVSGFTDPDGHATTYSYDAAGLLTQRAQPGALISQYAYDSAGRPSVTTQPDGTTVTASYDDAGRLTRLDYSDPATHDLSYTYDPAGRRASMTDGTGTTSYTYDPAGRLTASTNGAGATVGYSYDPGGRLTTLTYPGGASVGYGYDNAGQMTSATDSAANTTNFSWTADGQLAGQADPGGDATTITHDPAGRTTRITLSHATTTLTDYTYGYDPAGQLTADTAAGADSHGYTFDPTSQLSTVATTPPGTTSPTTTSYTTTASGELTGLANGTTQAYNTAEQLTTATRTAAPATSYSYDANGDRMSGTTAATDTLPAATTSYTYASSGALTGVTETGATPISYSSDGDGLRQTRTHAGATSRYTWATAARIPVLLDDGTHHYLYGPTLTPYAQVDDTTGAIQYPHTDLIGSVRAITDATGAVTATSTYDPYGSRTAHTGTADSPIGYTGNWTDPDTGLIYLRARDYDPATGQFLTIDPAADTTHQPYAYAGNNPLQGTDPTGLICISCYAESALTSGPSNWLAHQLQTGITGDVVSFFEGVGDGATFGLTKTIRDSISPGASCFVNHNLFYFAGDLTGIVGGTVIGGRIIAGALRTASAAFERAGIAIQRIKAVLASSDRGAVTLRSSGASAAETAPDGIVYLRSDLEGGKPYVGQAKSESRYFARQAEHARANPDADFDFEVLGRADPGTQLNRLEEFHIRQRGGPTNLSNPDGGLANLRHQMSESRYLDAGGDW